MSPPLSFTVATWNMEWKQPGSPAATVMLDRLGESQPDIVCLTEAYDSAMTGSGHLITAEHYYGYPSVEGRRKVMLWSREPWQAIDAIGHSALPPGRYIAGKTTTPAGPVTVIGVCIPWRDAHVRSGRRDRAPWEDHLLYLSGLAEIVRSLEGPLAVVGDFNQRIPRTYTPEPVHAALLDALSPRLVVATAGLLEPLGLAAIDHVAHSGEFSASQANALSNTGPDGDMLSDHFGVVARLVRD